MKKISWQMITDLKEEFTRAFPYLKIEIIPGDEKEKSGQTTEQSGMPDLPGDVKMNIQGKMKVNELEQLFKEKFSLPVQIFRKSGNLWMEITISDNLTLEQQNYHGKEISNLPYL